MYLQPKNGDCPGGPAFSLSVLCACFPPNRAWPTAGWGNADALSVSCPFPRFSLFSPLEHIINSESGLV